MTPAMVATGVMGRDEFDRRWCAALPEVERAIGRVVASPDLRDDAVMEAALRAYANRDRYTGAGNFEAWACGVARHVALDLIRRACRRVETRLDGTLPHRLANGSHGAHRHFSSNTFHNLVEQSERQAEVIEAVELARSRHPLYVEMALRLARGEGTMEEIAANDGIPYGTVKTRAFRGRRALQQAARELEVA